MINDLYDLLNIKNVDYEKIIRKKILEVKQELNDLDLDRMCLVYASSIYSKLKNEGLPARLIDTKNDLGLDYQHYFVLVFYKKDLNYVVDLTYIEFGYNIEFEELYNNGYELMDNNKYNNYLNNIVVRTKR